MRLTSGTTFVKVAVTLAAYRGTDTTNPVARAVEIVTLRVKAIGLLPKPDDATPATSGAAARKGTRRVHDRGAWREVPIWDRDALGSGDRVEGPAVVEEPFATHFIPAGWTARPGTAGALVARREQD